MLALIAAVIQHTRILQRLEAPDYAYNAMRPITVTVAIMLLMIGAFGLVGILLRPVSRQIFHAIQTLTARAPARQRNDRTI